MSRAEDLAHCKNRALLELSASPNSKGIQNAFNSLTSDFGKYPELAQALEIQLRLGGMMLLNGNLTTIQQMTDWIEGFN